MTKLADFSFLICFAVASRCPAAPASEPPASGPPPAERAAPGRIAELISRLGGEDMARRVRAQQACDELIAIGRPAVPALIEALESPDTYTRVWAAAALGAVGDSRAVEPMLKLFSDREEVVRRIAAWHARKWLDDPRVEKATTQALADPSPEVRVWAVRALSERKPGFLATWIRDRLKSDDAKTLKGTLDALQGALPPPMFDEITLWVLKESPDATLRAWALKLLLERPERKGETIEALIGWLESLPKEWSEDAQAKARRMAVLALDRLAGKPFGDSASGEDRESEAKKWRAWWEENRPRFLTRPTPASGPATSRPKFGPFFEAFWGLSSFFSRR